jgi:hypothetical protein
MDIQQEKLAELDRQIRLLQRSRRFNNLWLLAIFAIGVGVGFAVAEAFIDPVTVITSCGGIRA